MKGWMYDIREMQKARINEKDECKIFAECEKALINGKMDDIREIQKALINQ